MFDIIILTCVSDRIPSRGIGAYKIASSLRAENYSVQVIDFTDWFSVDELVTTLSACIGDNTKMVGVSSTFYQRVHNNLNPNNKTTDWLMTEVGVPDNVLESIKITKSKFPNVQYVLGGANSFLYQDNDLFDAVFHSYSDNAIIDFLKSKRIHKNYQGKKIIEGEEFPVNVEELKHSWAKNDFILPGESLPIEISRGCIFKCKFCNFQLTGKKKLDYLRNADHIKQEILENYERYGTTNYMFTDDTFNDSTYKLETLHNSLSTLPFKVKFTTYLRLDLLHAHPEQIPLLKDMGLSSAFFGIESFNEKTSKFIGKGLSPHKVKDTLLKIKNEHFDENFSMLCSFIIGLPYDTLESIDDSFNWTQQHDINTIWMPLHIRNDARYKSDIDLNYEKYGYKIDHLNEWTNSYTNFREAITIASTYQSRTNNTRSTWPLFAMASLGKWSVDELSKTRIKDLDISAIESARNDFIKRYKTLLFNSLNIFPV